MTDVNKTSFNFHASYAKVTVIITVSTHQLKPNNPIRFVLSISLIRVEAVQFRACTERGTDSCTGGTTKIHTNSTNNTALELNDATGDWWRNADANCGVAFWYGRCSQSRLVPNGRDCGVIAWRHGHAVSSGSIFAILLHLAAANLLCPVSVPCIVQINKLRLIDRPVNLQRIVAF